MSMSLLLALCLVAPDKFWLAEPPTDATASPAVIVGVLLEESQSAYRLRVQGGEIWLPKSLVVRVEKDGLTPDAIAEQEARIAAARAEQPTPAASALAAVEAAAERPAPTPAQDESAPPAAVVEIPPAPPQAPAYDPVLRRAEPGAGLARQALMDELWRSYKATKNRALIQELRRLRRGRD